MLTKKQLDLLEFIQRRIDRDGVSPSFDEMKEALDLRSKSGIHRLITALEERGFIRRLAHRARALEIVKLPDALVQKLATKAPGFTPRVIDGDRPDQIPPAAIAVQSAGVVDLQIKGRIAAGDPIEAMIDSGPLTVPESMLGGGEHYALEVKGESMIEAGINNGDMVIIQETSVANDGDIVVALVDDYEATLKRFRRKAGMIHLEAANPAFSTRILRDDEVKVQGRLVGLIRSY